MASDQPPPRRCISHYEILAPLGKGGMGEVYVAFDTTLQRKVALKAVRQDRVDDEARARLLREARILSQLDHPGICRVFDYVVEADSDYLVLELIDGRTLREAMAHGLDRAAQIRIAEQIAQALAVAHAAGVVHRDLKPDNVMLLADGTAKVLDFGIARSFDAFVPVASGAAVGRIGLQFDSDSETLPGSRSDLSAGGLHTVHGILLGTPAYMSPEQASGEPATAPSDMYAFGLLLQELLTGVKAYDLTKDLPTLLDEVRRGEAREAHGVPRDVGDLLARLKSLAPSRRPTAVDAAERLRLIREKPARRLRYAMAAVAVLLVIGGAVKYTMDLARERTIAVLAREDATRRRNQAEDLIGFMLGDLRGKLQPVGRLDVLDAVGDKAMAYFAAVPASALSDEEVRRRSQAIYQIGEVSRQKGDLKSASARYKESLDLISALAQRDPQNAQWQVDLAASHFYAGDALRLQGDLDGAMRHFTAYRDIGDALAARDPKNPEWLLESSYGHSNVAAIFEARGDFAGAKQALIGCVDISRRVVALKPDHAEWQDSLANTLNRLAVVLENLGEAQAALQLHLEGVTIRKGLVARVPNDRVALRKLANAASWVGNIYRDNGDYGRAMEYSQLRSTTFEQLVAHDPANAEWRRDLGVGETRMATLLRLQGKRELGLVRAERAVALLRPLAQNDPSHARRQRDAADAAVELATGRLESGRVTQALAEAARAAAALDALLAKGSRDLEVRRLLAEAYLVSADALRPRDPVQAHQFLERARVTLAPVSTVKERRLQRAWALVLRGLGRTKDADAVAAQLRASGFRPFTP